jgi:hypothetical protein
MTSPTEMKHVGASVAATALLFAGATAQDAQDVVRLIESAAASRLALERRQGAALVAAAADKPAAEAVEIAVDSAWRTWYAEALRSVLALSPGGAGPDLSSRVDEAVARLAR